MTSPPLYGLDIETNTHHDGFDASVASVLAVAVVGPEGEEVFDGPEPVMLGCLDRYLAGLPAGVVVTWNGARFDLPFLARRARFWGIVLGLHLRLDPVIRSWRAGWHGHRHLDVYRVYRSDVGPALRVSCSLKSIARLVGLVPVEVDASQIHLLPPELLRLYVASDAALARTLAERRWASAERAVDAPFRPP